MTVIPIDVEKSFHYSRVRTRAFRALGRGAMYPSALAREARIDARTLRGVMHGDPPRYHRERALVSLGLVERVEDVNGGYFQLTSAGRRALAAMRRSREEGFSIAAGAGTSAGTVVPAAGGDPASAGAIE